MSCLARVAILSLGLFGAGSVFAAAPITTLDTGDTSANTVDAVPTDNATPSVQSQAIPLTPDERLTKLENQVQYLNGQSAKVDNLSTEIEALRGKIEELSYQLTLAKKQIALLQPILAPVATNTQSVTDVATPSNNTPPVVAAAPPAKQAAVATAASPKETAAFQKAYQLLLNKQYSGAIIAFNNFLNQYPQSAKVSEAHYWLGDLYLAEAKPDNASMQYRAVIKLAPHDDAKVPVAMLKLGTILAAYGDSAHAKELFQNLVRQYPNTAAAKQALQKLKEIN